ncbi:hypothetical protein AMTR_s00018p00014260 [Amborella trichopoda]|uniref:Uncharacterized protein n=1 Tax=Amborella trichopoda TaxID=13333 RepID=W1PKB1_AMBTC|nr:hypothetical protein AMTR_s00018p00014260 [Amborella trichopoda]
MVGFVERPSSGSARCYPWDYGIQVQPATMARSPSSLSDDQLSYQPDARGHQFYTARSTLNSQGIRPNIVLQETGMFPRSQHQDQDRGCVQAVSGNQADDLSVDDPWVSVSPPPPTVKISTKHSASGSSNTHSSCRDNQAPFRTAPLKFSHMYLF